MKAVQQKQQQKKGEEIDKIKTQLNHAVELAYSKIKEDKVLLKGGMEIIKCQN